MLQGTKQRAKSLTTAGAPGKASLPGRLASFSGFTRARDNQLPMDEAICRRSSDFQTCRIADSPKSAGREAALEAGLEICATRDAQWRLIALVCHWSLPAIGKSRSRGVKSQVRIAHPRTDCAFRMDPISGCITHLNLYRAGRVSNRLE